MPDFVSAGVFCTAQLPHTADLPCEEAWMVAYNLILVSLHLKSSEFVSDFSMIWRDANGRGPIAR
jgi:hypothetical protein